jgi:hypothetical protein
MAGEQFAHATDGLQIRILGIGYENLSARHDRDPHLFETFQLVDKLRAIQFGEPPLPQ